MWRNVKDLPSSHSIVCLFAPNRPLDSLDEFRASWHWLLLAYHDLRSLHALILMSVGFMLILDMVLIITLVLHLLFLASLPDITRLNFLYTIISLIGIELLGHCFYLRIDECLLR